MDIQLSNKHCQALHAYSVVIQDQIVGEGSGDRRRREVLHNLRVMAMWHNLRVMAMQLVPPWDVSA
jgi:hypothetical protein